MKKVLVLLNIILIIISCYLFFVAKSMKNDFYNNNYKSFTEILNACQTSSSSLSIMRKLYPEKVVYYNGNFLKCDDYNEDIPLSNYDVDLFDISDHDIAYYKDLSVKTWLGVDVSHYSEDIDWSKVKDNYIDFAMIRVGYRGYQTGLINKDSYFENNYLGCNENGIKVGVYFFSQAINEYEAKEEALFVIDCLKDKYIDYPVVYDFEIGSHADGRAEQITNEQVIKNTKIFLKTIEEAGYTPMIYGGTNYLLSYCDTELLTNYDIWYAQYANKPYYPYVYTIWQFTEKGTIEGIKNKCDLNLSFKDYKKGN